MIWESQCENLLRTLGCEHLPVRRNLPPVVFSEENVDGQLDLNHQVGVKPGGHVLPAGVVAQVDEQIADEANQDEGPGRGLQEHAQAQGGLVSAVGREDQAEAGEGEEDHGCEQADVQRGVDVCRGSKEEGHLGGEELQTEHDDGGQDLGEDQ